MTDIVCCPLDGGDGDGPRFSEATLVRAKKAYRCVECHEPIAIGTKYERTAAMWPDDKRPTTFHTCLSCMEIRNHFACTTGWVFGNVWSNLEDNFFPDMKAGGPCMKGLSPEAKDRLFTLRLKWLEDNADE